MFRTQWTIFKTLASLMALGLMDGTGAPGTGSSGGTGGNGGEGGSGGGQNSGGNAGSGGNGWDGPFDESRARRALDNSRASENEAKENARKEKERADAAEARTAQVLAALGLKPDGSEDPAKKLEEANKKAADAEARAKARDIELAVFKIAADPKIAANAAKLLDSRSFMSKMDKLNPDGSGFEDKVREAIKESVKDDPTFGASAPTTEKPKPQAPFASTGGGSFNGGGGQQPTEPKSAHERLTRAYAANSQTT